MPALFPCSKCHIEKPFSAYYKDNRARAGRQKACKDCTRPLIYAARAAHPNVLTQRATTNRTQKLRRDYKLTTAAYDALYKAQDGRCLICNRPERRVYNSSAPTRLAVDHDHETLAVRGLLCRNCNAGLGMFDDNPDLLQKAVTYLGHRKGVVRRGDFRTPPPAESVL